MSEEIKQMLDENIVYLATSTRDGKPNVIPIGSAYAISDNEILIHDMMFVKTRANLEANHQVAIAFTDTKRWESYQLKGTAKIFTDGEMFDKVVEIMKIKAERHKDYINAISDPKTKERAQRMMELHMNLRPKAAVLITVEEIYSNMPKM
ncbi:MAG: pyridoxamine 5'-phosphate oxidase family protein [Methanothrix sp.]|uniref:pyridoxamine 5'-phosphate oxidase family protein n=1 Tax=Methanothrix sp. TaxID=90426 RepID=UPI003C735CBD